MQERKDVPVQLASQGPHSWALRDPSFQHQICERGICRGEGRVGKPSSFPSPRSVCLGRVQPSLQRQVNPIPECQPRGTSGGCRGRQGHLASTVLGQSAHAWSRQALPQHPCALLHAREQSKQRRIGFCSIRGAGGGKSMFSKWEKRKSFGKDSLFPSQREGFGFRSSTGHIA